MDDKKFTLTQEIDQLIDNDDRNGVIRVLMSICYRDRGFHTNEFDDGLAYTQNKLKGSPITLLEPFEKEEIYPLFGSRVDAKDDTLVERDYASALTGLGANFCNERIDDTKKLGRFLFPLKKSTTNHSEEPVNIPPQTTSSNPLQQILMLVGGILAVVALVLVVKNLLFK